MLTRVMTQQKGCTATGTQMRVNDDQYPDAVVIGSYRVPWNSPKAEHVNDVNFCKGTEPCCGSEKENISCKSIPAIPSAVAFNWRRGSKYNPPFSKPNASGLNDMLDWHYSRSTSFGSCCACHPISWIPRCTLDWCSDNENHGFESDRKTCTAFMGCGKSKNSGSIYKLKSKSIQWKDFYLCMKLIFSDLGSKLKTQGNFVAPPGYYFIQDIGLFQNRSGEIYFSDKEIRPEDFPESDKYNTVNEYRIPFHTCGQCFEIQQCKQDHDTNTCNSNSCNHKKCSDTEPIIARVADSCTSPANSKWCEQPGFNDCASMPVSQKSQLKDKNGSTFEVSMCPLADSRQTGLFPDGLKINSLPFANSTFHLDTGQPWTSNRLNATGGVIAQRYKRVSCPVPHGNSELPLDDDKNTAPDIIKKCINNYNNLVYKDTYYSPICIMVQTKDGDFGLDHPTWAFMNVGGHGSVTSCSIRLSGSNNSLSGSNNSWIGMTKQNTATIDYPRPGDQSGYWSLQGYGADAFRTSIQNGARLPMDILFTVGDQWDLEYNTFQINGFLQKSGPSAADFNFNSYHLDSSVSTKYVIGKLIMDHENPYVKISKDISLDHQVMIMSLGVQVIPKRGINKIILNANPQT